MDAIWLYAAYWERILKNTEINKIMKKICLLLFLLCACIAQAQNAYRTNKDISYVSGSETDTYRLERCKLDIYYPENKKDLLRIEPMFPHALVKPSNAGTVTWYNKSLVVFT